MAVQKEPIASPLVDAASAEPTGHTRNGSREIRIDQQFGIRGTHGVARLRIAGDLQVRHRLFFGLSPEIIQRNRTVRTVEPPQPVPSNTVAGHLLHCVNLGKHPDQTAARKDP